MNIGNINSAIDQLRKKLIIRFGEEIKLYLFGSVARGDFNSESDIDILVLLPFNLTYSVEEEIFNVAYDIELEYDVIFGIIVYSSNFWFSQKGSIMPLFQHIQEEGKTI